MSEKVAARILAEQIEAAVRLAPFSILVSAGVLAVVVPSCWSAGFHGFLAALLLVLEAVLGFAFLGCRRWLRAPGRRPQARRTACIAIAAAALIGTIWGITPIILFPHADPDLRLMIACTMAGLACTGVVLAPLVTAAQAFVAPLIIGSGVALYRAGDPFYIVVGGLLAIYAAFITSSIAYLHQLFRRRVLEQIRLENQSEMIRLLLWDYDQSASDWFWETDSHFLLRNVSSRFSQAAARAPSEIEGVRFLDAPFFDRVGESAYADRGDSHGKLAHCVAERMLFRDVVVRVRVGATARWWSLTGRPFFDESGMFEGYHGVGSDVTDARLAAARISHQARHDSLTGLLNRAAFLDALGSASDEFAAPEHGFALLNLDLDGFKEINDTFGHPTGDDLLRAVAGRLRGALRDSDSVARIGGDEFAILHADASAASAAAVAQRTVETLSAPYRVAGVDLRIGVSIGIALAPGAGERVGDLIANADLAMYEAKRAGKGTYRFFKGMVAAEIDTRRLRPPEPVSSEKFQ